MRVTFKNTEVEMVIKTSRPELTALHATLTRGLVRDGGSLVSDEMRKVANEVRARIEQFEREEL